MFFFVALILQPSWSNKKHLERRKLSKNIFLWEFEKHALLVTNLACEPAMWQRCVTSHGWLVFVACTKYVRIRWVFIFVCLWKWEGGTWDQLRRRISWSRRYFLAISRWTRGRWTNGGVVGWRRWRWTCACGLGVKIWGGNYGRYVVNMAICQYTVSFVSDLVYSVNNLNFLFFTKVLVWWMQWRNARICKGVSLLWRSSPCCRESGFRWDWEGKVYYKPSRF